MENKEEIVIWLNNNKNRQESEIRSFLLSKMQEAGQKESWQKSYFLKDLKRIYKDCPANILKIINDLEKESEAQTKEEDKKKGGWGGYVVAGLIYAMAQSFNKSSLDALIIIVIAIVAWIFYRRLKSKIKVKNEVAKVVITAVLMLAVSAFLIGFLTSLADRWQAIAVRTPFGSGVVRKDVETMTQLNSGLGAYLADYQKQINAAQNSIEEKADSSVAYSNNITGYQNLEKLSNERYARFVLYSNQVKPILGTYSPSLMDAFSQMADAAENTKNVSNDVFEAEINYYQALLDGLSKAEINTKISTLNNAVDRFNQEQQTATQATSNWQKAYDKFFGS